MKITLATLGSLGDLHPFIAVARRLAARGYEPVVASLPEYRERVQEAGVAFHPVRPSREDILQDLGIDMAELARRAMTDVGFIFRDAVFPYLEAAYRDLLPLVRDSALVLTHSLAYSARIAAEVAHVPHVTMVLQPSLFLSAYDPPRLPGAEWLAPVMRGIGPRASAVLVRGIKKLWARRFPQVSTFCRSLGLRASGSGPAFDDQFSPCGTLALYSPLLGPAQPDFPPASRIVGFAFYDGGGPTDQPPGGSLSAPERTSRHIPLEPELAAFLGSGPPPLVFTLGSFATERAGDFYDVSREAAHRVGRRAVLLVGSSSAGSATIRRGASGDLYVCAAAPYSELFAHAAAVVHHGGIGTLAQALRAGKPQLIVPIFADQPDNAARAVRLGVARAIPRRRYSARRAVHALERLLKDPGYASRASRSAEAVGREDGAEEAALLVDRLIRRSNAGLCAGEARAVAALQTNASPLGSE